MFTFVLKSGSYVDLACKKYKKGDTIVTSINLAKKFRNKFELISEDFIKPEKEPKIPEPAAINSEEQELEDTASNPVSPIRNINPKTEKKAKKVKVSEHGENVTSEFPIAKDVELQVFVKKNWYVVVDPETGEVENDKKLRKDAVNSFLEEYLEEGKDDDEDEYEDLDEDDEE